MKTPEEIKKGLENDLACCSNCNQCYPTQDNPYGCAERARQIEIAGNAFAYIQQLEDQFRDLTKMVPKWISVEERLPQLDQEVLLIAHGWKSRILYIGCLHHIDAQKSWLTGITSKESDWLIHGWSYLREPVVTHWMLLPEPPKEDA